MSKDLFKIKKPFTAKKHNMIDSMIKKKLLASIFIWALVISLFLFGVYLLLQTFGVQMFPEPEREMYLHYTSDEGGGESKLYLVHSELFYGVYNDSFNYSGVVGSYSINKGDPCVIINGTVRNDYDKDYYFAITAKVYNSTGGKIGPILNANSPMPGISVTKIDSGSIGSFEIEIRYAVKDVADYNLFLMFEPTDIPLA